MMPLTQGLSGPGHLELPAVLDLRAAKPLADALLALRGRPLTVDASRVEKLGGQCVQVLLSAARTWDAQGGDLKVADASPAFVSGLRILGLSPAHLSTTDPAA